MAVCLLCHFGFGSSISSSGRRDDGVDLALQRFDRWHSLANIGLGHHIRSVRNN
jgi:hypothetical protein